MTFEDRASDAGGQLGKWSPPTGGSEVAVDRARHRRRRRQGGLGAVAAAFVAASMVALWPADEGQRVIADEPPTTVDRACTRWNDADLIVYLNADADPSEIAAVGALIDGDPRVASSRYLDDLATYRLYQDIFREERPELVEALEVGELPTSFRVMLADVATADSVAAEVARLPGVYDTDVPASALREPDPDGRIRCPRPVVEPGTAPPTTSPSSTTAGG